MKVLHRDPRGGVVILNPPDLKGLVAASGYDCATVVIDGPDIVASTVLGLSHHEAAAHAGFCNPWFDAENPEGPQTGMLCLMADETGITLELWPWDDGPECPCDDGLMRELFDRVVSHPKLARMVAKGYEADITIFDSGGMPTWTFDASGVSYLTQRAPAGLSL